MEIWTRFLTDEIPNYFAPISGSSNYLQKTVWRALALAMWFSRKKNMRALKLMCASPVFGMKFCTEVPKFRKAFKKSRETSLDSSCFQKSWFWITINMVVRPPPHTHTPPPTFGPQHMSNRTRHGVFQAELLCRELSPVFGRQFDSRSKYYFFFCIFSAGFTRNAVKGARNPVAKLYFGTNSTNFATLSLNVQFRRLTRNDAKLGNTLVRVKILNPPIFPWRLKFSWLSSECAT